MVCPKCKGLGVVVSSQNKSQSVSQSVRVCDRCEGTGVCAGSDGDANQQGNPEAQ